VCLTHGGATSDDIVELVDVLHGGA
jgi:hypothetical protein